MRDKQPLHDRVQRISTTDGDDVIHKFANGLTLRTEVFLKSDSRRILPLGSAQGSLMNHMLHFPDCVEGKRIFEPFAGSGPLGFMALKLGADHVDFLDINPRAVEFQLENGRRNSFEKGQFNAYEGDIAVYEPDKKYDVLFANPPFVPTPVGLDGSLTSNGGSEGNRFAAAIFERLEQLIVSQGRAFLYLLQFVADERPLITDLIDRFVQNRAVEITPCQTSMVPLKLFADAYVRIFEKQKGLIEAWHRDLTNRYGSDLSLCHYIIDVGPQTEQETSWSLCENFSEKFGSDFLVPSENSEELAFSRAFENLVPNPIDSSQDEH